MRKLACIVIIVFSALIANAQNLVHPGILHKRSDLDRMKAMVKAKVDPWYSSFKRFEADKYSSKYYSVQGNSSWTSVSRENPSDHRGPFENDARAAYQNAIMWYITGNVYHAQKAVEILNTWSNITNFHGGGTEPLCAGMYGWPIINAAEIIKHTSDKWKSEDIKRFEDMLVYPGYSSTEVPSVDIKDDRVSFYWRIYMGDGGRHGNQDLAAWMSVMAMGIFLDNELMYKRALNYVKGLAHPEGDLPCHAGPKEPTSLRKDGTYSQEYKVRKLNTIPDYGYNGVLKYYIWENGQCQEHSRDLWHANLGMGFLSQLAEMAWNQGDDLYGWEDNRLLLGYEFHMRYDVSSKHSYPDQTSPWNPTVESGEFIQQFDRTARWKSLGINPDSRGKTFKAPIAELPLAHYMTRTSLDSTQFKWLKRARDKAIEERGYEERQSYPYALDYPGYGALTFRRLDATMGDPVVNFDDGVPEFGAHSLPGTIRLVNFDYYPEDAGGAEGKTFMDKTEGTSTSDYRKEDDVQIGTSAGKRFLTELEPEEWYSYTVSSLQEEEYDIELEYAAFAKSAKVKLEVDGEKLVDDVEIPFNEANDSQNTAEEAHTWQMLTLAKNVTLKKGLQNVKLFINGEEKGVHLNSISFKKVVNTSTDLKTLVGKVKIYPNPANGLVTIDLPEAEKVKYIQILSVGGQKVLQINDCRSNNRIDISELKTGLYLVKVSLLNGQNIKQKLIVK
ncbi:T9SS type A sorting domain-containing protein [Prolixibacteraceae bacterium JC049]|nr:T9SS type A sorting domain-containing protein [Prolixibacteraceae bacterium JC049]